MDHHFKVIFFDLGDTLFYDKDPWEPIFLRADAAMRHSLEQAGYPLTSIAYGGFHTIFDMYYARREGTLKEETTVQLLRELMAAQDAFPPDRVLLAAVEALYVITQENWYVEADAAPTLQTLKDRGCRLGIISNAADDENVQGLVDKGNLRPYFDLILSSAACRVRKPARRIFQLALDHFGVPPQQTVMVGDILEADIQGANQMGMYAVWINRHSEYAIDGELPCQPQAVISALSELPALLEEITTSLP